MKRKHDQVRNCPPEVEQVIYLANALPEDYVNPIQNDSPENDYPELNAERQKRRFFAIVKTLPEKFLDEQIWLQKVISGKTLSPQEVLENKDSPFYKEVSETPSYIFETVWHEYLTIGDKSGRLHPLDELLSGYIYPAIRCRRVLYTLWADRLSLVSHTINGKRILPSELLENCQATIDDDGVIEWITFPINILFNSKVETKRIRVCPECQNFYWAKRTDSKTCGKKECVEKNSGKKWRETNKAEAAQKKRIEYYKNKDIEYCLKCFYPLRTHGETGCNKLKIHKDGTL